MKKLEELKRQKQELVEQTKRADISNEELTEILEKLKKVNAEIKTVEELLQEIGDNGNGDDSGDDTGSGTNDDDGQRGKTPIKANKRFAPVFATDENKKGDSMDEQKRTAFRNYVTRGIAIPLELRESTQTTDIGAVIPENLIQKIIDTSKEVGKIFASVTKTNFPVGPSIPKASFRPTVEYVAQGSGSQNQKAGKTDGSIVFGAYKVNCRVAWTEETDRMALDIWETYFVGKVVEAIVEWKEKEILFGTGTNAVKGILSETPTFALERATLSYEDLLELEGELPSSKDGAKWYMSKKTFYNTFKSILDDMGNPVASLNQGTHGKIIPYILGREVIYIDEYMPNHKSAEVGKITAFMYDFKDYAFNENYNLGVQRRVNWDNDDHELKCVFACDGKALYTDSLIVVKKANA